MTTVMPRPELETRLLGRIRERADQYFPDRGPISELRVISTSRRRYSEIYRVALASNGKRPKEIVIKVFWGARAQFAAMTDVWAHFAAHPSFAIPRPLDLLEDGPALVMEAVSGTSLQERLPWLAWGGRGLASAEGECRAAGEWLRFYHDLARPAEIGPLDTRDRLDDLTGTLAAAGVRPGICRRLDGWLRPLAKRLDSAKLPVSHVHGEFTLDNVFVADGRVIALDLWGKRRDVVAQDISSFLNSVLLLRLTRPAPRSALRRLRAAFLGGYFGMRPWDGWDGSAIVFLQGTGLAGVAVEILARRRGRVVRAWVEWFLKSTMDELTTDELGGRT